MTRQPSETVAAVVIRTLSRAAATIQARLGRHTYWLLVLIPLALFAQLGRQYGLYELGDVNFPVRPLVSDYFLPWQERASAGFDNVFIGVPRLVYYGSLNALLLGLRNAQLAQWLWYAAMGGMGVIGAYLLARRLGADRLSVPLACFYAFNLWAYDRAAQASIFFAYEGLPLVLFLMLQALQRQRLRDITAYALSIILVLPSLQITLLAFMLCAAVLLYAVATRRISLRYGLAIAAWSVAAVAFFTVPAVADLAGRNENAIGLVGQRFDDSIFKAYAVHATLLNSLRLASFFYSSLGRQPILYQWLTLAAPVLALLAANILPNWRKPAFAASALCLAAGLWLVDGVNLAPALYLPMRHVIPGLRYFVEPDYFAPLVVLGLLGLVAAGSTLAAAQYGRSWSVAAWVMGLGSAVPFLPFFGPLSGLPQSLIPGIYVRFQQTPVAGRTLWLPNLWVARYLWSPYVINGFTVVFSPSDAMGPYMLEWSPASTNRMMDEAVADVQSGAATQASALLRALGIGTIAIAADQLSPDGTTPNPLVTAAQTGLASLIRTGAVGGVQRLHEAYADIVAARTSAMLPIAGLYPPPLPGAASPAALAQALAAEFRAGRYRPFETTQRATATVDQQQASFASRPSVGPGTCRAQVARVHRLASVAYDLTATFHGRCSLIFRDTFSSAWRLAVLSGAASVDDHFEADGYANGWIVRGDGPVVFRLYDALAIPYLAGCAVTLCVVLVFLASLRGGRVGRRGAPGAHL
jgi:hypothetical protein